MDITASLSTSDFDLPSTDTERGANVTQDSEYTCDAMAEEQRRAEIAQLQAELDELSRQ